MKVIRLFLNQFIGFTQLKTHHVSLLPSAFRRPGFSGRFQFLLIPKL